jgi:branched-chain amino acid transport system permease protein
VQILILRRLRGAAVDTLAIVTIGVDILLSTELIRRIGTKVFDLGDPWKDHVVTIAGLTIPSARVATGAWMVAGALAALGGVFFTTFPTPGVDSSVGLSALTAFPAAILGGLDSIYGAVVGGLIVGVVATLTAGYQDELSFLGRGLGNVTPYVVMVLILLWRPSGLFGTKEVARV